MYACVMTQNEPEDGPVPCAPDLDEDGVDLTQIRQMLDLAPGERLLVIQNLWDAVARIRALNGTREVR